jgi:hypothetical protein
MRWDYAVTTHRCAIEEQGDKKYEDVGRIRDRTGDFAPTEHPLIGPISVGVATPVISKVSAICLALVFCEEPDGPRRIRDEEESSKSKSDGEGPFLSHVVRNPSTDEEEHNRPQ